MRKKVHGSWMMLFVDMRFLMRNWKLIGKVMGGKLVPRPFRERLMLAVTAVYGCRYCSWLHTREALRSGISQFLESLEADSSHAKLVYDRARKFFTDIPHELL